MSTMPCRDCGRSVTDPATSERLTVSGRSRRVSGSDWDQPISVTMTRCEECAARLARARAMLKAHPLARQPLGGMSYAMDVAGDALIALDLARVKPRQQEALAATDLGVAMLLARLGRAGSARYSDRPSPVVDLDGETGTRRPWEHVTDEKRQRYRDAYASLLQARTERPVEVPAPDDGAPGCLLCGVGAVRALPSRAGVTWGPLRRANPDTLGGRPAPEPVVGHLCPACASAASDATMGPGAQVVLGRTALERALYAHLEVEPPPWQEWSLPRARAWAALPPGTPPNATPWAHEPLDRLAEELKDGRARR